MAKAGRRGREVSKLDEQVARGVSVEDSDSRGVVVASGCDPGGDSGAEVGGPAAEDAAVQDAAGADVPLLDELPDYAASGGIAAGEIVFGAGPPVELDREAICMALGVYTNPWARIDRGPRCARRVHESVIELTIQDEQGNDVVYALDIPARVRVFGLRLAAPE